MPAHVLAAALFLLSLAPRGAHADALSRPDESRKSPAIALAWSAGLTAAGGAIVLGGFATDEDAWGLLLGAPILFFGPAFGRGYAHGNIVPGLLIRGATGLVALHLINENILQCTDECAPGEDPTRLEGEPKAVVYTLAGIFLASAAYDIVRAPLDAREFNRTHAITVAPTVMPAGQGGALAPGVAVSGQF
ncbi:MAG TPA: hypothetical protein VIG06_08505 [Kofleriaceae bacterium]|jgi:hypothetical protein